MWYCVGKPAGRIVFLVTWIFCYGQAGIIDHWSEFHTLTQPVWTLGILSVHPSFFCKTSLDWVTCEQWLVSFCIHFSDLGLAFPGFPWFSTSQRWWHSAHPRFNPNWLCIKWLTLEFDDLVYQLVLWDIDGYCGTCWIWGCINPLPRLSFCWWSLHPVHPRPHPYSGPVWG